MRDSYEVHHKQTCLSHGHSCVVGEGQNDQCLKDKTFISSGEKKTAALPWTRQDIYISMCLTVQNVAELFSEGPGSAFSNKSFTRCCKWHSPTKVMDGQVFWPSLAYFCSVQHSPVISSITGCCEDFEMGAWFYLSVTLTTLSIGEK